MKRFIPKTLALLAIVTLAACNDNIDFEYSDYHCNLTIDNSVHLDPTLASAMSPLSPGVFTTIKPLYKNSLYYFEFFGKKKILVKGIIFYVFYFYTFLVNLIIIFI